jgi:hypothetical protein
VVRFIHLYLIAYFVLVIGAGQASWQAGALTRVPAIWMTITAIVVIGLEVILAVSSRSTTHG